MKVNIIGTGSIGSKYMSATTLIDNHVLVDIPNGATKFIKELGYDISQIDTILITHLHGDHFFDLPFLMLEKYFNNDKKNIKIICPVGTTNKVEELFKIGFPGDFEKVINNTNIEFIEQSSEGKIKVNNIKIEIINVEHGKIKPSFGYIVSIKGCHLALSGDSSYCQEVDYLVQKTNTAILDMSLAKNGNDKHMGYNDINNICQKNPNKTIIATHMQDITRKTALNNPIKNLIIPETNFEIIIKK